MKTRSSVTIDVHGDPTVTVHCSHGEDRWSLRLGQEDTTYLVGTADELEVFATQVLRRVAEIRAGEHREVA